MGTWGHGTAPERPLDLAPERFSRTGRPAYAIIDIGSNSVRLVVYDEIGRAPFPRFNEKALCQLGDGFARTGALTPDGVARTLAALRRFRAIADAMAVERIDTLATEAVRQASNGPELVAQIARQTGLSARILSGEEEAYFGALGVVSGFYRPTGLVGDMGGGSLEMADVFDDRVGSHRISLPLGALPVRRLLEADADTAKARIDTLLRDGAPPGLTSPTFFAVGGGWRAFARVHLAATRAPVQVVHGYTVPAGEARAFAKSVLRLSPAKIAALPGLPRRRAGSLPAAALVLDRVVKRLQPERVVFSMLGVREGWLYSQLSPAERYLDPFGRGRTILRSALCPRTGLRGRADAVDGWAVRERNRRRTAVTRRCLRPLRLCLARRSRTAGDGKFSTLAAVSADRAGPHRARVSRRHHSRSLWRRCG